MFKNVAVGLMSLAVLTLTPMAVVDHIALTKLETAYNLSLKDIRAVTKLLYITDVGNGSGVMVGPRQMLTAAHVAVAHTPERPLMVDGKPIVRIIKIDEGLDIALLEVDVEGPYIEIGDMPTNDARVYLVGYPSNQHVDNTIVTEGRVMGRNADRTRVVATTPASPGNSGGGLFEYVAGKWKLVGILTSTSGATIGGFVPVMVFHLSLSVDTDSIKKFLNE